MTAVLNETEFTAHVAERLGVYPLTVNVTEPLCVQVLYGENEPVLTLKLAHLYDQYKRTPEQLQGLIQPVITEVGWTINGTRYNFSDIAEFSLPIMRDMLRVPLKPEESGSQSESSKGPLLFQELVSRPEEHVIVQFVLAKNELIKPLFTGDMLRSYPEPKQFTSMAVHNLRNIALKVGLTLSEYQVENFNASPWLVGFRGGAFRDFISSLITVPEVMKTLEQTVSAYEGLVVILPCRDMLLISTNTEETAVCEMGLLAGHLKDQSPNPVSSFVWHFKDGTLERVQTIDLERPEATGGGEFQ